MVYLQKISTLAHVTCVAQKVREFSPNFDREHSSFVKIFQEFPARIESALCTSLRCGHRKGFFLHLIDELLDDCAEIQKLKAFNVHTIERKTRKDLSLNTQPLTVRSIYNRRNSRCVLTYLPYSFILRKKFDDVSAKKIWRTNTYSLEQRALGRPLQFLSAFTCYRMFVNSF